MYLKKFFFGKIIQTHKYFTEIPFHFDLFNPPPHVFVRVFVKLYLLYSGGGGRKRERLTHLASHDGLEVPGVAQDDLELLAILLSQLPK